MELWLVRHGLPLRKETSDGSPADPALSAEGIDQATRLAQWLDGVTIDRLVASPLLRARETAAPLASLRGLTTELEPGVAEFDQDSSVYVPLEELKQHDYPAWQALVQGGYRGGLDLEQFHAAVIESLERIVRESGGQRVVVVCHGGVVNTWAAHVLGMAPRLFFEPGYTSVSRFLCASSGERSVVTLNEMAHLDARRAP